MKEDSWLQALLGQTTRSNPNLMLSNMPASIEFNEGAAVMVLHNIDIEHPRSLVFRAPSIAR
jgi:hypothetical protein